MKRFLIECEVCGEKISSAAKTCPHCGDPTASSITIEEHDKLEAYKTLYKAQMGNAASIRSNEWKVTVGAWTLLVSAAYAASAGNLSFGPKWALIFIPIFHLVWLVLIHSSQDYDKKLWAAYRLEILKKVDGPETKLPGSEAWEERPCLTYLLWLLFEVGVTSLFAFFVYSQL